MTEHDIKRIINQFARNGKGFPSLQEICTLLNYSEEQSRKCMQALEEDGYVKKTGSWYKFSPESTILKDLPEVKNEIPEEFHIIPNPAPIMSPVEIDELIGVIDPPKRKRGRPFGTTKKKLAETNIIQEVMSEPIASKIKDYATPIKIIQIIMAVIGTGAAIASTYFTFVWLNESMVWFFALMLSAIMIAFSVAAFEVVIIFLSGAITDSKFIKVSVGIGFIFLWLLATSFSIMSTVGGQVNKSFANKEAIIAETNTNESRQWQILQEQKADLKDRLNEDKQQIQVLNSLISGMSSIEVRKENRRLWNDSQWKLKQAQRSISKVMKSLNSVREQEKALVKSNKSFKSSEHIPPTFYAWLGALFSIKPDWIQFGMSLIIPVFADLIAPAAIAVALFLKNK